ncbi:LamG domain-containing protein [Chitinophagaceae bacterium LB-8]|uniref:LamG domain-containing protein n=1 Tax=Paraflavisolibacter caeni TaxID=2982496 RepID=A0A9X2Y090_9BACT|nr:LamG-like jellyroll fold domain-containing protein [Paraflavisolibacter caeni]MCU7552205.1 LamG domain-containing protein [Paraflavisolibacter caeni]
MKPSFRISVKKLLLIATATIFTSQLMAQQQVLAHYNMGRSGAVSYATAPEQLSDMAAGHQLKKAGQPVFFADAPADKKLDGEGAILFKDKAAYSSKDSFAIAKTPFVLELWLQPNARQGANDPSANFATVFTLGSAASGYQLAQKGNNWVILVDGKEVATPVATVVPGEWMHIALVSDGKMAKAYADGLKKLDFQPATSIAAGFTMGAYGKTNSFRGLIYEVRLSQLKGIKFDAARHLLYNARQIAQKKKQATDQQRALIASLVNNKQLKKVESFTVPAAPADWLINQVKTPVELLLQKGKDELTAKLLLTNGIVSREFYIAENLACISFRNHLNDAEFLRAVKPEARVMLDSTWYNIGGLSGQPEKSYLMESWYNDLFAEPSSFRFAGLETKQPEARYPWQQKYNAVHTDWPPKGLHVIMHYQAPLNRNDWQNKVSVDIHYELYEGMPVMAKWMTIANKSENAFVVRETECEVLAVNQDQVKRIHMESDYSFALANADPEGSALIHYKGTPPAYQVGQSTTTWRVDNEYNTWASHNQAEDRFLDFPHHNLLVSRVPMGPSETLQPKNVFTSFTTFELLQDSDDRERQSLAHRRFYRKLAPQVTESLITGGITSHDRTELKNFITQMGELGFERLDIMAWPGISHDKLDTGYVALWKEIADFAKARGIVMGGYELQVASRGRGAEVDCIDPITNKPGSLFGQSVCIASNWKDTYYPNMWKFYDQTGLMTYNMDGPYHGDVCAATNHAHHKGMYDSQWEQWKTQVSVLHELQRRNMYVPIPDWYFLNGQSATGMGYREASANLTPQQQLLLGRQYIFDGTWHKAPTMGWLGLQLVGFYTNDPRVGLEPLSKNLDRYEIGLFQHLASGCQFTVRGKRLYDTPETKAMVSKWINWFKEHRAILTSDIIHVSRPTGRDLDAMFHVNPFIEEKGMLVVFNPTDKPITKQFKLPLYYTGIKEQALIINQHGQSVPQTLNAQKEISLQVEVPAGGYSWYLVKDKARM